jgi:hypothetical protein
MKESRFLGALEMTIRGMTRKEAGIADILAPVL